MILRLDIVGNFILALPKTKGGGILSQMSWHLSQITHCFEGSSYSLIRLKKCWEMTPLGEVEEC